MLSTGIFCQPAPASGIADFAPAAGSFTGTITYLDYTSGKPFTMPAHVTISFAREKGEQVILSLTYPQEPKANGNDTLFISDGGAYIDGARLVSRKFLSKEVLQLITEKTGKDGNDHKPALLRHIYTISKKSFSNRKEVKFEGTDQWIMRNEYSFVRQ